MMIITMNKQKGFSIVEVFVAVGVGIILMTGVINIYLASKRTYQMNNEIINFQENARYISTRLGEELRMAGHAGCVDTFERGLTFISSDFNEDAATFYRSPVQGMEYTASSDVPNPLIPTSTNAPAINALNPAALPNSDILSVQYAGSDLTQITANMTTTTATLAIDSANSELGEIEDGDIMVIADCNDANVFVSDNTTASDSSIAHDGAFIKSFAQSEEGLWPTVMRFESNTYYVGQDNVLYQRNNLTGQTVRLFDGITSMNITYGVEDTNGLRYMNATDIAAENLMNRILIIKIDYNLRSRNQVETASGSDYTQRSYSTTVVLRNQGD